MSSSNNTNAAPRTDGAARIPSWLSGNDVRSFAAQARLKFHPVDVADRRWRVESVERYEHGSARLVELVEVAARNGRRDGGRSAS